MYTPFEIVLHHLRRIAHSRSLFGKTIAIYEILTRAFPLYSKLTTEHLSHMKYQFTKMQTHFFRLQISLLHFLKQHTIARIMQRYRSIAQSGSASGLGPEGREFESLCSDHSSAYSYNNKTQAPLSQASLHSANTSNFLQRKLWPSTRNMLQRHTMPPQLH